MDSAAGKTSWKRRGAEERAGTVGGKQDTTAPDSSCVPLLFQNQTMAAIVRSLPRPKNRQRFISLMSHLSSKLSRSTPAGGDGRRGPAQKGKRKERLAVIFFPFFFFFGVSQPGSQPVRHEASHPASKQANQSVSFSGATGTGPTNATEQRATVLHHFPSQRPRRLQLLITRLCQAAAQGLHQPGLFAAFSHYITIMLRPHSGRGFRFSGPQQASKS